MFKMPVVSDHCLVSIAGLLAISVVDTIANLFLCRAIYYISSLFISNPNRFFCLFVCFNIESII